MCLSGKRVASTPQVNALLAKRSAILHPTATYDYTLSFYSPTHKTFDIPLKKVCQTSMQMDGLRDAASASNYVTGWINLSSI